MQIRCSAPTGCSHSVLPGSPNALGHHTGVDLRNAIDAGLVVGPRLVVAGHVISATAGHGDLRSFYGSRWDLPVSTVADGVEEIRRVVRREHAYGSDWIKTANAGGYFSIGDDPARTTWFDEEMAAVCSTAHLLGMPVAVHTGAAQACKQAIRYGARSLEHAYLIDEEGIDMAIRSGAYIVPTMQMTQEDLSELQAGTLPCQAVWKLSRDNLQSSTPSDWWPQATPMLPSGPTAGCSLSATASASSRPWSPVGSIQLGRSGRGPR